MIIANNGKNDKVGTKYVLLTLLSLQIRCVHILTLVLLNITFQIHIPKYKIRCSKYSPYLLCIFHYKLERTKIVICLNNEQKVDVVVILDIIVFLTMRTVLCNRKFPLLQHFLISIVRVIESIFDITLQSTQYICVTSLPFLVNNSSIFVQTYLWLDQSEYIQMQWAAYIEDRKERRINLFLSLLTL